MPTNDKIADAPIYPENGAGGILFEFSGDEVVRRLGSPSKRIVLVERTPKTPYGPIYAFRYGNAMMLVFNGNYDVHQIILGKDYKGTTADGVGIGSTLLNVMELWGAGKIIDPPPPNRMYWSCDRYPDVSLFLEKDANSILRVSGFALTNPRPPRPAEDILPNSGQLEKKKRGLRKYWYKSNDKLAKE